MRLIAAAGMALAVAAFSSACAYTPPPEPGTPMASLSTRKAAARNPNAQVCKQHDVLGTHRQVSECHTRAEWEEMAKNSKHDVDAVTDNLRSRSTLAQ